MLRPEWSTARSDAMSKLVADIIVDTLQKAGVRHCYTLVVHFIFEGKVDPDAEYH
jgi:hypothetical protein